MRFPKVPTLPTPCDLGRSLPVGACAAAHPGVKLEVPQARCCRGKRNARRSTQHGVCGPRLLPARTGPAIGSGQRSGPARVDALAVCIAVPIDARTAPTDEMSYGRADMPDLGASRVVQNFGTSGWRNTSTECLALLLRRATAWIRGLCLIRAFAVRMRLLPCRSSYALAGRSSPTRNSSEMQPSSWSRKLRVQGTDSSSAATPARSAETRNEPPPTARMGPRRWGPKRAIEISRGAP